MEWQLFLLMIAHFNHMKNSEILDTFLQLQMQKEESQTGLSPAKTKKHSLLLAQLTAWMTLEDIWTVIREERNHRENA